MRILIIILIATISLNCFSQSPTISSQVDWSQHRALFDANFDTIYSRVTVIDDTSKRSSDFQQVFDSNSVVEFRNGIFTIDETLLIPSNFHLIISPSATLKLGNEANKHLFHNKGLGVSGLGSLPDSNITIDGGGILDGNKENQTRNTYVPGSMYNWELFWLAGIDNLKFRDLELKEARTFSSRFSGNPNATPSIPMSNFLIENIFINQITIENNGDGIHLNGPAHNGIFRNIWGSSADDDFFALIPDDAPLSTWGYVGTGDINNITVENIAPDSLITQTLRSVTGSHSMDNVTYRRITAHTNQQFMLFGNNGEEETGVYKDISFFNINSEGTESTLWCGTYFADTVENLYIEDFNIKHGSGFYMINTKTESVYMKNITFSEIDTSLTYITDFQSTADIEDIVIENLRYTYEGAGDRLGIIGVEGTSDRVLIKDSKLNKARNIFRKTSSSDTINTVIIENCDFNNGRVGEPIISATFVENIIIDGCRFSNIGKIIDQVSIKNITIKNCIIDSLTSLVNSGATSYDTVNLTLLNNTITRIQARPFRMFSNTSNRYWFIKSRGNTLQYDGAYINDPLYSDTPTYSKISWDSDDFVINTTYINNPQDGDHGVFNVGGFRVPAFYSNGNWYNLITGTTL